jgi:hypothetical protein
LQATGFRSLALIAFLALGGRASAQQPDSMWTVRGGEYNGRTIRIDSERAGRKGSAFLRVSRLKGDQRYVGWNPSRLPARVAFRPGRGITTDDSVAFWSIVNRMERDLGVHLFEPTTIAAESDPEDVIIVDTKPMANLEGRTYLTWSTNGGVYDARIYFRSSATLHSSRVVTHEMMHTLGFGHTSAWMSIMNQGAGSPTALTVEDVAYTQFALESRAANEREDMWERLALANDREFRSTPGAGYEACAETFNQFGGEATMKTRAPGTLGVLAAMAACRDTPVTPTIGSPAPARR